MLVKTNRFHKPNLTRLPNDAVIRQTYWLTYRIIEQSPRVLVVALQALVTLVAHCVVSAVEADRGGLGGIVHTVTSMGIAHASCRI